jgi:hypothetical protein
VLEEREIEALKIESKRTLELVQFVDADEIDPLYFETLYYVAPKEELAEEAFVVRARRCARRARSRWAIPLKHNDCPSNLTTALGSKPERQLLAPKQQKLPSAPHAIRCSPRIHRTVPELARITTLSVVRIVSPVSLRRRFTPRSSEPSVTPVAAKMQSPLARSSSL